YSESAGKAGCEGITVLEVLVASSIGMLVLLAMTSLTFYTARGFAAMGNYADLDRASRNALDQMTRDIRSSQYLVSSDTNQLIFNMGGTNTLRFTWNQNARTLTRYMSGEADRILLGQ